MSPRVSAIITTCARPHLVGRAVESALTQTLRDVEVIVIVDGADAATLSVLRSIDDPRLRVHALPKRGGQAAAINCGVLMAEGNWAAMLDDDDEWMPEKLEQQLRAAERYHWPNPVVGCRFRASSESGDVVWPLRSPHAGEPVSEYLFCRTHLAFGEGVLPTSTLFAPTALFREYPMAVELRNHCDLDWLLRVDERNDVGVEMPPGEAPLAVWQMQSSRERLSNSHDWRFSHEWIVRSRNRVTPRAYAGFLLTWVSQSARLQRDYSALPFLLKDALQNGDPGVMELAIYGAVWGLPPGFRGSLSRALSPRRKVA